MHHDSWASDDLSEHDALTGRRSSDAAIAGQEKSVGTAYLLWLLLGSAGGHNYYVGKPIYGLLQFRRPGDQHHVVFLRCLAAHRRRVGGP